MSHESVLLEESIQALSIVPHGTYVDVTYGGGGHTKEILKNLSTEGKCVAIDQDQDAQDRLLKDERLLFINENFRHLRRFLKYHKVSQVNGILADLGMSSFQLDSEVRGFATRFPAELDMRMNKNDSNTAAQVLNEYTEKQLQQIFQDYGELRNAKSLAKKIILERTKEEFTTTDDFIQRIQPLIKGNENRYLAQVFQALRIEVNKEMEALQELLKQGAEVLQEGGRFVVITFHSIEDRMVKRFFKTGSFDGKIDKDVFGNYTIPLKPVNKKPIEPSEEEKSRNPRSRSAKLRIAVK